MFNLKLPDMKKLFFGILIIDMKGLKELISNLPSASWYAMRR